MTSKRIEEMLVIPSSEKVLGRLKTMLSPKNYNIAVLNDCPFFRYLVGLCESDDPKSYGNKVTRMLSILEKNGIELDFSKFLTMNINKLRQFGGHTAALANIKLISNKIKEEIKAYQDKQSVNSESESAPE